MTSLSNEQVFAELYYTKSIIRSVTGELHPSSSSHSRTLTCP